jgi:hypothetical protein
MRYFSYNEYDEDQGELVVTKSEEDIRKEYWPYWYGKMCDKFGQFHVDENYTFEDCLEDWIVVNWAWAIRRPDRPRTGQHGRVHPEVKD